MLTAQQVQQDLEKLRDIVIALKSPESDLATTTKVINGIELNVFAKVPDNLRGVYKLGLEAADKDFLVYEDERFTFAQSLHTAEAMSQVLLRRYGIKKGDRVAVCSRNYPEWCLAYMAITMIGAIVVPMNSWWQSNELVYGIKDSGTRVLFADQERIDQLLPVIDQVDVEVIAIKPSKPDPRFPEFHDLVAEGLTGEQVDLDAIEVLPEDDASIMYTSGSTGNPKGVLSTHRNIVNALYSWIFGKEANDTLRPELVEEDPEFDPGILSNVPLFHVTGSHAQFLVSFIMLRKFVMMYKWNAEKALELIEQERLSVLHGVPTMTWEVMNSPMFDKTDLRSLRIVQSGGAARPPGHLTLMKQKFDEVVQPGLGYGLTETNAIGATITGAFYLAKPESTGRPTQPVTEIRIEDERGNVLPNGQIGEICIKGATIMKAYWNRPEETAKAIKNGWFHTGDIGLLDEHGFLVIKDRAKDIVIRGGENVACAEVEYALCDHPDVCEAAVYGLPDERLGEIVGASVMVQPGSGLDEATLQVFLRENIAHYKVPSHIAVQTKQLERIATGKIAKKLLREQAIKRLGLA
ncbi:class I adenylate-forming enzyme family protein [Pseudohongiella sp. O18]|uniref:class I adenylate-forming enzyme family protein n=1 Tax=Pseudohongiella sp. O18 TaxID=2904248 RepID=UPI001F3858A2|nr:class I adenylate-forming enzyme family protein [Pseudohongiella sp. O18]